MHPFSCVCQTKKKECGLNCGDGNVPKYYLYNGVGSNFGSNIAGCASCPIGMEEKPPAYGECKLIPTPGNASTHISFVLFQNQS